MGKCHNDTSLEIVASCGQKLGLYSKIFHMRDLVIKIKVKVCSAISTVFCRFCTRPRYQVSVYRTIDPLVYRVMALCIFHFLFLCIQNIL